MKKKENEKQFRELSDEELEKVNGGSVVSVCDFATCRELGKETDLKTCECI